MAARKTPSSDGDMKREQGARRLEGDKKKSKTQEINVTVADRITQHNQWKPFMCILITLSEPNELHFLHVHSVLTTPVSSGTYRSTAATLLPCSLAADLTITASVALLNRLLSLLLHGRCRISQRWSSDTPSPSRTAQKCNCCLLFPQQSTHHHRLSLIHI